jgi:hypothetical protein
MRVRSMHNADSTSCARPPLPGSWPGLRNHPLDSTHLVRHAVHDARRWLIEDYGVLAAGDMLSDLLMPFLDLEAANPIEDYLAALRLFESVADDVDAVVPGHGSVGGAEQL